MTHVKGTIYLLHFDPPYKHAKHYLGWTEGPVEERISRHLSGQGSPLVRAAVEAGCGVILAQTWSEKDRFEERRMKNCKNTPALFCPLCREKGL